MSATLFSGWVLALLLGFRHVSEPDHLAAVGTLLAEPRARLRGAAVGALWGLGHAASLLVVGVLLLAAHRALPARAGAALELLVSAMLLALGARALWAARAQSTGHHAHSAGHDRRPLTVGLMHGLAGSGALTALALGRMAGVPSTIGFLLAFALGSALGMATLTAAAEVPLRRLLRSERARLGLTRAAGLASVGVGLWWACVSLRECVG